MKFFIAFALFALVAAKPSPRLSEAQIEEIVDVINRPTTNLATAAALKKMLLQGLGLIRPIQVGPAIVDGFEPIAVGPTPVEIESYEPVHVGPTPVEIESFEPIHVGPEIVDFPVPESAVLPTPISSPLVQIIVNVKNPENLVGGSPVVVEGLDKPEPIDKPTPVHVAEYDPVVMEPVIVADNLPPLMISPVAVGPEILN